MAIRRIVLALALAVATASCDSGPPPVGSIESIGAGASSAVVGRTVSVQVRILDEKGRPIEGLEVRLAAGAGSVTPALLKSDAQGLLSAQWTLGTKSGAQSVTASAGAKSITIGVTALPDVPTAIAVTAGQAQAGAVGERVATAPIVRVGDQFQNGVPNVDVTFRVTAGGGALSSATVQTGASGDASPIWTLGPTVGDQALSAEVTGLEPARVTVTALAGPPARVVVVSGSGQSGPVGKALAAPIVIELRDRFGNLAVNGRPDLRGDGSATLSPAVAGGDGRVSLTWTLGTRAGAQVLRVVAGTADSAGIAATAAPGPPSTATRTRGDGQRGWTGGLLADSVAVTVKDQYDNAVPGVSVDFAVTAGGGSTSPANAVTRSSGEARSAWRLGPSIGPDALEARVTGIPAVPFGAVATSGPPAAIVAASGDAQTAQVAAQLSVPIVLRVRDSFGNAVQGAAVDLSIQGTGGSITPASLVTDTTGGGSFRWTLGTKSGPNVILARSGDAVTSLTATGTPGPAQSLVQTLGDGQSWTVGLPVPTRPTVQARDAYANGVPGIPVTFEVVGGGGSITGPSQTTDVTGSARVGSWTLGATAGTNTLRANSAVGSVDFTAVGTVDNGFTIEVVWVGATPAPALQAAVNQAVTRWSSVITGELSNQLIPSLPAGTCGPASPALTNRGVDDILIFAEMAAIDGPGNIAGYGGTCVYRDDGKPLVGLIRVDAADVASLSGDGFSLNTILTHEIGHVLGIGVADDWYLKLVGYGTSTPYFNGASARARYFSAGGLVANAVPVEGGGGAGTANAHWRESDMGRELMTGYFTAGVLNPLSAITVGALADLGYVVSYAGAEGYAVGSGAPAVDEPRLIQIVEPPRPPAWVLGPDGRLVPVTP